MPGWSSSGDTESRGPDRPPAPPAVLFIGGFGRSGSTLLEALLAQVEGTVALGEVEHLWERGVLADEKCGCGLPFSECPFWTAVGDRAFGGWDRVDVQEVLSLKRAVIRQRHLVRTMRRRLSERDRRALSSYSTYHRRIYLAAAEITGARVVVDSSKFPPMAVALAHDPEVDLRVAHVVRDSRGVAYSWSKTVARPETAEGKPMPRYAAADSTVQWVAHNLAVSGLRRLGRPVTRLRYEDMVEDAGIALPDLWVRLNLPGVARVPMVAPDVVDLSPSHTVAGNPMRFRTGPTTLRRDDEWRSRMQARDRVVVTLLSFPLLRRYGYLEGTGQRLTRS